MNFDLKNVAGETRSTRRWERRRDKTEKNFTRFEFILPRDLITNYVHENSLPINCVIEGFVSASTSSSNKNLSRVVSKI